MSITELEILLLFTRGHCLPPTHLVGIVLEEPSTASSGPLAADEEVTLAQRWCPPAVLAFPSHPPQMVPERGPSRSKKESQEFLDIINTCGDVPMMGDRPNILKVPVGERGGNGSGGSPSPKRKRSILGEHWAARQEGNKYPVT